MSRAIRGAMEAEGAGMLEMWIPGQEFSDDTVPGMWNGPRYRCDGLHTAAELACVAAAGG
ncbi:MAG: hypothetical protein GY778_02660 [bacterium]|nr:hypothetical protein [bacterium]